MTKQKMKMRFLFAMFIYNIIKMLLTSMQIIRICYFVSGKTWNQAKRIPHIHAPQIRSLKSEYLAVVNAHKLDINNFTVRNAYWEIIKRFKKFHTMYGAQKFILIPLNSVCLWVTKSMELD